MAENEGTGGGGEDGAKGRGSSTSQFDMLTEFPRKKKTENRKAMKDAEVNGRLLVSFHQRCRHSRCCCRRLTCKCKWRDPVASHFVRMAVTRFMANIGRFLFAMIWVFRFAPSSHCVPLAFRHYLALPVVPLRHSISMRPTNNTNRKIHNAKIVAVCGLNEITDAVKCWQLSFFVSCYRIAAGRQHHCR